MSTARIHFQFTGRRPSRWRDTCGYTECGLVVGLVDQFGSERLSLIADDLDLWSVVTRRCLKCVRGVSAQVKP